MLAKGGGWSYRTIHLEQPHPPVVSPFVLSLCHLPHNAPALCGMTGQMGVGMYSDLVHNMWLGSGYLGSLTAMVIMICDVEE